MPPANSFKWTLSAIRTSSKVATLNVSYVRLIFIRCADLGNFTCIWDFGSYEFNAFRVKHPSEKSSKSSASELRELLQHLIQAFPSIHLSSSPCSVSQLHPNLWLSSEWLDITTIQFICLSEDSSTRWWMRFKYSGPISKWSKNWHFFRWHHSTHHQRPEPWHFFFIFEGCNQYKWLRLVQRRTCDRYRLFMVTNRGNGGYMKDDFFISIEFVFRIQQILEDSHIASFRKVSLASRKSSFWR